MNSVCPTGNLSPSPNPHWFFPRKSLFLKKCDFRMSSAVQTKKMTLEEYFELEYRSKTRHEYLDGIIQPVAYTSPNHGRIVRNLTRLLDTCLLDTDSEMWINDRMIYVPDCNRIYYPDGLVVTGKAEYFDYKKRMQATLNPSVIIEVLSDSTEDYDRFDKWRYYKKIPSLQQCLLIGQKYYYVDSYRRSETPNIWLNETLDQEEQTVLIEGCAISLKELYRGVVFEQAEAKEENQ